MQVNGGLAVEAGYFFFLWICTTFEDSLYDSFALTLPIDGVQVGIPEQSPA